VFLSLLKKLLIKKTKNFRTDSKKFFFSKKLFLTMKRIVIKENELKQKVKLSV